MRLPLRWVISSGFELSFITWSPGRRGLPDFTPLFTLAVLPHIRVRVENPESARSLFLRREASLMNDVLDDF